MENNEIEGESIRAPVKLAQLIPNEPQKNGELNPDINSNFGYFDPNEAPLYDCSSTNTHHFYEKEETVKIEEEYPQEVEEKPSPKIIEEEVIAPAVIEYRFDDPFIIIKKDNRKKPARQPKNDSKLTKTKPIKKEK